MLIDWFTVGAQVLNFLVLVWLMKRFLYQPILNAIDAREQRIATELAHAADTQSQAAREREDYQQKNEVFAQQRAALLSQATDEANAERLRLLDQARQAAEILSAKQKETLANEMRNLTQSITRRTQDEVFSISRKTLGDLASVPLENQMVEVFTRQLRELTGEAKQVMADALKTESEPAILRSAFDLPAEQQSTLQSTINETFSADIPLRFETDPDTISGIELSSNGQKISWSIDDYLASLEEGIGDLLKAKNEPKAEEAKTSPEDK
ncbi:MAG: hypothetical protein WD490_09590 [Opitutales bacterium]